jgi:phosphohistidine phosphatase SixA
MRWTLFPLLLLTISLPLLPAAQEPQPQLPLTVILVRHAETAGSTRSGGDPLLSEAGLARSKALARLLSQAAVTHLFSSELARTQATLEPLAKQTGLKIRAIANNDDALQLRLLQELAPGSVAVVCGHSNTVPAMAQALGLKISGLQSHPQYGSLIPHASYDRLYVLTLPRQKLAQPSVLELRYGKSE